MDSGTEFSQELHYMHNAYSMHKKLKILVGM